MELLAIILIVGIFYVIATSTDRKYDNYTPPKGYQVDHKAMMDDMIINHASKDQVKRNVVNGKYNVKSK